MRRADFVLGARRWTANRAAYRALADEMIQARCSCVERQPCRYHGPEALRIRSRLVRWLSRNERRVR